MSISPAVVSRALGCALAAALLQGTARADAPGPDGALQATSVAALPAPALEAASMPAPALDAPLPASRPAAARRKHILGLQLDAGVPDVAGVSVLYRPWKALRFSGGMLYNMAGYGVRAGASVQPYFPIAPSLSVDVGHYFGGNVYKRISSYTTVDENLKPVLSDLGYTFVNASVGLELGHPDWFVFFIRGGLSKMWLDVRNANASLPAAKSGDTFQLSYVSDPSVKLGIPNVKLGFMIFFY